MNRVFLITILAVLSACSTVKIPPKMGDVLPPASTHYPSPDGRMYATIRYAKQPYTVAIIESETEKVLGLAESSVRLSEDGDRMHGQVRVAYSDDLSTVVVHEDFSDASPNPRYILFQRSQNSLTYNAMYFSPPTEHTDAPGEFDFICPFIQSVTNDTITLNYDASGQTRVIRISELLLSHSPRSSQEWPSEAYARYDSKV